MPVKSDKRRKPKRKEKLDERIVRVAVEAVFETLAIKTEEAAEQARRREREEAVRVLARVHHFCEGSGFPTCFADELLCHGLSDVATVAELRAAAMRPIV